MTKPFLREEFFCRISQNIEILDKIYELKDWATRDYLTGLHNRRFLFDAGKALMASAIRGHLNLAIAIIDIDHFKRVNDTHGHEAGDEVLKQLAETLRQRFRETDVITRMGGEEFCVLLVNYEEDQIPKVFEQLRQTMEASALEVGGHPIPITVSIGVNPVAKGSLEDAISLADDLLYQAKQQGRNQVAVLPSA